MTLLEGDRELFTTAMPFLWHPYLYHCGTNARVLGEGPYTVRVRIEPAAFMRQDPVNGKRYERQVEAVFEDPRFTPGRKPSRDAQPAAPTPRTPAADSSGGQNLSGYDIIDWCPRHRVEGGTMDSISDDAVDPLLRDLQGWQRHGDSIWRAYQFDDFGSAAQFVGRVADATGPTGHQPDITIRGGRVTLELHPAADAALTADDLAVASRIQRLVGDHHHPIGRAAPWSPAGRLTGIHERPVGPAGP